MSIFFFFFFSFYYYFFANTKVTEKSNYGFFFFCYIVTSKFTFEKHICSILFLVAKKIGQVRKSFRNFRNQDVLLRCSQLLKIYTSPLPSYSKL